MKPHRNLRKLPWWRRFLAAGIWVGALAGLWLTVMAVESRLYYQSIGRQPYRTSHVRIAAKKAVSTIIDPFYDARLLDEGLLPEYRLTMSSKRLAEWKEILNRVYARGVAEPEDQIYLPAVFQHRDLEVEVDVRGRGTLFTHYKEAKPSFRVRFPRDGYFRGNRVINLIIPYDQARVVGDTSINSLAKRYGLITIPTRFVSLTLNDETLGVYHEVEHFRKELAVKQFRSEGFFMSSLGEPKGGSSPEDHPGFALALEAFSHCVKNPCGQAEVRAVLDHYVDFDKMALYAAITTLFGAKHGWGEDNLILFFDPPRGRFEPVPWDMGTLRVNRGDDPFRNLESVKGIGSAFLRFDDFRLERDRYVWDILKRHRRTALEESDRLYGDIRGALAFDTEHSRRYTQRMVDYFQGALKHNFDLWQEHLQTVDLRARRIDEGTDGSVELINHGAAAIRLEGPESAVIPGRYLDRPGRLTVASPEADWVFYNEITGEVVPSTEIKWLEEAAGEPGESAEDAGEIGEASWVLPEGVEIAGSAEFPEWVFSGTVRITETTTLPLGVRVRFEPGLRLILDPGVSLVIQGDLTSEGTASEPIWVGAESLDEPFMIFAVLGRSHQPASVRLKHTTLRGGTEGLVGGSYFTGMFSVYDGHLNMQHSRIEDVLGEDGLNVKFGLVEMRDSVIERTFSDAVDLDFCRGIFERNEIRGAGGDSLDFSGSLILARNNLLEDTTDKGVSVGEATTALLSGNDVVRATTGTASKDSSWVVVDPGRSEDLKIGLATYQKKQIFNSGLIAFRGEVDGEATPFLADPLSWLHRLGDDVELTDGSGALP